MLSFREESPQLTPAMDRDLPSGLLLEDAASLLQTAR